MALTKPNRISSLDLLKGIVMVIMALDHARDYFHDEAFLFGALDPAKTYGSLFFTRWISHFCAPAFCFLAGTSAFLVGKRKSKKALSKFLLKRGLWLVAVEIILVNFGWHFDILFQSITLQVIWSLGVCMILLAAIIHLPIKAVLAFSLIVIFGHNLLDEVQMEPNFLWSVIHEFGYFQITPTRNILLVYPILPWVGVMSLGYYFGTFYNKGVSPTHRRKLFNLIGISALVLFVAFRLVNGYGNMQFWKSYETFGQTFMSFMAPAKYPPSLTFLLMTLGVSLLFLANTENVKGRFVNFFSVFGKVPFFYYILHIYVIHAVALLLAHFTGFDWHRLILTQGWYTGFAPLNAEGYGVGLAMVYLLWILVVLALYPFCKRFSAYKLGHKDKWWLSYL